MTLEIHPIQESDFLEVARIQHAAFSTGGGMTKLLAPDPLPEDWIEKSAQKHLKSFRDEADVRYLKVIDTELGGKMIAVAKWRINETEKTEDQVQSMLPVPGPGDEERPALVDFFAYLRSVRIEYMGNRPFYFLHILVTDPEHHRRGAGAMLIAWGTKKADAAQLPSFLEASRMGRPLYARMGFVQQHEETFDLTKYGLQGTDTNTPMLRQPQPLVS